jgi:hypothetical protein
MGFGSGIKGSEIRDADKTYPGSRIRIQGSKSTGSRIRISNNGTVNFEERYDALT